MCSMKNLGPKMEPWGTTALTVYSCENVSSITTQSCLLLRKDQVRSAYQML